MRKNRRNSVETPLLSINLYAVKPENLWLFWGFAIITWYIYTGQASSADILESITMVILAIIAKDKL